MKIILMELRFEHDVVHSRQRARHIAGLLGFDNREQTQIATAVSEIARNAYKYAGGGKVEFSVEGDAGPQFFLITIRDQGPGIAQLQTILDGRYVSATGMGLGIIGSKKLMDKFEIRSGADSQGTTIVLGKRLTRADVRVGPAEIRKLVDELASRAQGDPFEEIQQQNQELITALDTLKAREEDLVRLNHELEDTNRGVVALYAELDEKADYLQRANEIKTRFLSNMTHEFRTPLNSILSLARLLLDRVDGPLSEEQEKQAQYIKRSAEDLSELVNDLLDLAKVEAGKVQIRPTEFKISDLFAALRGMLKPLLAANSAVQLNFEAGDDLPVLETDEGKVSQILRNFISNALKFTERGEIRVSARHDSAGTIVLSVADTGIGIAEKDQERVFEEFGQVDSALQKNAKGTGLGLPLSRKLASLLGGSVMLKSEPGVGSTFSVVLPVNYRGPGEASYIPDLTKKLDPARAPVLVIEDNRESLFVYEKYLKTSGFQAIPARTLKEARIALSEIKPVAIIADILLEGENTWSFIADLKSSEYTRHIPILVITMIDNEKKARNVGADAFHTKPAERTWLVSNLIALTRHKPRKTLLMIDDDDVSRYILRSLLAHSSYRLIEAVNGLEGLKLAREESPSAILLDLSMPEMNGFETIAALKADPGTASIPVIIHSSRPLNERERHDLEKDAIAILPKEAASRETAAHRLTLALKKAGLEEGAAS